MKLRGWEGLSFRREPATLIYESRDSKGERSRQSAVQSCPKTNRLEARGAAYDEEHIAAWHAVVQGSETWTRKGGRKGHFVWTDTWLRRHGQWQIVAAEDVSVPIKE